VKPQGQEVVDDFGIRDCVQRGHYGHERTRTGEGDRQQQLIGEVKGEMKL